MDPLGSFRGIEVGSERLNNKSAAESTFEFLE
jgi:hypothetical protein